MLIFLSRALGILPADIMSIYFGACNTPFGKFILVSFFGLLPRIIGDPIIGRKTINPASPELAVKGSLEKAEAEGMLARLNELAITAIPKFDFSAAHDAWLGNYSKMPDTCAYREFVKKIIAEVCELFNYPEYFHLCMGDETVEYQKHYGLMIVRGPKAYWRDAYAMFDVCRECGAKPIISGDSYYRDPLVFDKMIPDDVVIAAPYIELWGGRIENETD